MLTMQKETYRCMLGAMIAYIFILSQQTVSVICGTARRLFKKLHCGERVRPALRLSHIGYPDATSSTSRVKTCFTDTCTFLFSTNSTSVKEVLDVDRTYIAECHKYLYIVPNEFRTYVGPKYDQFYTCLASITSSYDGEDTIDLVRSLITPTMNDNTVMMVVDVLAHINRHAVHTEHAGTKRRFTRAQWRTIWHNRLKPMVLAKSHLATGPKSYASSTGKKHVLQADEIEEEPAEQCSVGSTRTLADILAERRNAISASIDAITAALDGDDSALPDDVVATPLLKASFMDQADEQKRLADEMLRSVTSLRSRFDDVMNDLASPRVDATQEYGDLIIPVAILVYNIYRSRNLTDALVAVVNFAERLSARNGHARMRAAATWATSYVNSKNSELVGYLRVCVSVLKHSSPR